MPWSGLDVDRGISSGCGLVYLIFFYSLIFVVLFHAIDSFIFVTKLEFFCCCPLSIYLEM